MQSLSARRVIDYGASQVEVVQQTAHGRYVWMVLDKVMMFTTWDDTLIVIDILSWASSK